MHSQAVVKLENCRVCNSNKLKEVLSLGEQFVIGFSDSRDVEQFSAPLDLVICEKCTLLQLEYTVPRDMMYRKYWYMSGISTLMVSYLKDIVISAQRFISLKQGDIVIDIGANDGTLLKQYTTLGLMKVGFEPSDLFHYNEDEDIIMVNDYFQSDSFKKEFGNSKAKIITSIAMFYDLDDPNQFVEDVKECLYKDGLWIIQMNYLGSMLKNNTFDNISHEHLEYYSLHALKFLLDKHNLNMIRVELNEVNGGSIRVYITHNNSTINFTTQDSKTVQEVLEKEKEDNLLLSTTYTEYMKTIREIGLRLTRFLIKKKDEGKVIGIYGASTRGFVLLQFFKIDSKLISFAVDKNSEKWGKFIPGTGVKIYSPDEISEKKTDYLLLLPYHLLEEVAIQESNYLQKGGRIIIPLPEPKLLSSKGKEVIN